MNKKNTTTRPARSKFTLLHQLANLIPVHLVPSLGRELGVDLKARTFSLWSHVVCLLYAQLTHALSLNDVADSLRLHRNKLAALRGATPPSRNGLSHASKERDPRLAEQLFWKLTELLQRQAVGFGKRHWGRRLASRFKRAIHVVDATTIELVANCLDWAKHRRRKAAAKTHLRLDLPSMLPRFAIVDTAAENDAKRAREVCAGIRAGEIVLFDRAYVDFAHLHDLDQREVYWVTRAKKNLSCRVVKRRLRKPAGKILRDDEIVLKGSKSRQAYPQRLRRVIALVEVDGVERELSFLTNNMEWAASTVAELYRCRWQIEVFFKQIKQTLKLGSFLGHSANAVKWQVWSALIVYLLLRYQAYVSRWSGSFIRLFALVRGALWERVDMIDLLGRVCGTAKGSLRMIATPQQAYLPGMVAIHGTATAPQSRTSRQARARKLASLFSIPD